MERLRRWLEDSGTSQRAFAEEMGVKQAAVSLWVTGMSLPRRKHLEMLASKTGLSYDELLGTQPKRKRANA